MSTVYQLKPDLTNNYSSYSSRSIEQTTLTSRMMQTTRTGANTSTTTGGNNTLNDLELYDATLSIESSAQSHRKRIIQTIVDIVVIIVIFLIFGLVYLLFDPRIRFLTCDQSDIFFPYKEDTIPFWAVGIYGTVAPILFIVGIELLNARLLPLQVNKQRLTRSERCRKYFICTFHALSLFGLGIALTLCLTEIGKRWV